MWGYFLIFMISAGSQELANYDFTSIPLNRPEIYHHTSCEFLVIAHRGASYYTPENTMAAFQLAYDMGAVMIELDVQLSKDEIPVVIHDADLKKTTSGKGLVSDYTYQELQKL